MTRKKSTHTRKPALFLMAWGQSIGVSPRRGGPARVPVPRASPQPKAVCPHLEPPHPREGSPCARVDAEAALAGVPGSAMAVA